MPFGWSDEPLYAEQKLANLFYTVDNTLSTLQKAYQTGNGLKRSTFDGFEFTPVHGYRAVMKYDGGPIRHVRDKWGERHTLGGIGFWMVYAERVGSLGDDRHKWPVWDAHVAHRENPPKGMLTRHMPRDYLGETFGNVNPRNVTEDHLIAASIEKNKWRPGPHNPIPVFKDGKIAGWERAGDSHE